MAYAKDAGGVGKYSAAKKELAIINNVQGTNQKAIEKQQAQWWSNPVNTTYKSVSEQAAERERQAQMRYSPTTTPAGNGYTTTGAVYSPTPVTQPETKPTTQPTTQQRVSYIDGNGDKQIGYAEVVAQPEAPAEAPAENTVDYWATMKEMYTNLYNEAVAANDAQAALAAERAAAAADEQLAALAAEYEGTNRQLYRDYMQTQRVLPQQLAAQGYSGGLSESARLRLGISYQDALARNEQARIAAAAGIGSERAQTEYEIAAAAAEANRQALANQNAQLIALEQERYQYDQALKEARVQQMAAAGDFTGMLDLGYSQDEVDYLTRVWLLENPGMQATWIAAHPEMAARLGMVGGSSSGGSGGGGGYQQLTTPTVSQEQRNTYAEILQTQAAANEMIRDGASVQEVQKQLAEAAADGTISYAAAQAAAGSVTNPTAGLTTAELNAMKKSSSAGSSGSKKNLWQSIGNAILAGINN